MFGERGNNANISANDDTDTPPVTADRAQTDLDLGQSNLPVKLDHSQSNVPVKTDLVQSNLPVKTDLDLGLGVIGGFSIALPPFTSPEQRDARTSAFAMGAACDSFEKTADAPLVITPSTSTAITITDNNDMNNDTSTSTNSTILGVTPTTTITSFPSSSLPPRRASPCPPSTAPAMARLALHYARSIRLLQLLSSCTTPRDVLFHLLAAVKWLVRDCDAN